MDAGQSSYPIEGSGCNGIAAQEMLPVAAALLGLTAVMLKKGENKHEEKLLTKFLTGGLALTMLFGSVACSNADKTYEYTKESDTLYYTNSDNTDLNLS